MPLAPGSQLGPYEIGPLIGAGGMGEVYRATDTKLKREVALKVLLDTFANDPERMARFHREAQVLASLSHDNIAQIHGVEESHDTRALVLELVEGPTLAEHIAQGPIPIDEALPIARQIADALEAAHDQGVVHRDLKPANIKLRPDGTVKVLDFGLAKASATIGQAFGGVDPANSPTITAVASQMGVVLGTAAYMSPEQAKGRAADRRADIWAFGCVLYEMLTGRRAFPGDTASEMLAGVLGAEVDLDALPASVPAAGRRVLRRCFEREPKKRLRDMTEGLLLIEEALEAPASADVEAPRTGVRAYRGTAAALILALGTGFAGWSLRPASPLSRDALAVSLPAGRTLPVSDWFAALSPNGRDLVYVGEDNGARQLYHRPLDRLDATPILDTDGATAPFFSPDGEWVGFTVGEAGTPATRVARAIRKVRLAGGPAETVCTLPDDIGWGDLRGAWSDDDTIWLANNLGLYQVAAAGGEPRLVTTTRDETHEAAQHHHPRPLPGGRGVLYAHREFGSAPTHVALYEPERDLHTVLAEGNHPWLASSEHILFFRGNTLWALPFDLDRLEALGEPTPVLENVGRRGATAQGFVGSDGTLVYVPGAAATDARTLVWVDRNGNEEPVGAPPRPYSTPAVSPDGTRIAVQIDGDIWVYDLARGNIPTPLTGQDRPAGREYPSGWGTNISPLWMPGGSRIAFASDRNRRRLDYEVFWQAADGSGEAELVYSDPARSVIPASWSSDGRTLIVHYTDRGSGGGWHIGSLTLDAEARLPLLETPAQEFYPAISPDSSLIAYVSRGTQPRSIFVQRFPEVTGGRWQVATGFDSDPAWSPDGRELYYRDRERGAMMAVPIDPTASSPVGVPRALFHDPYHYTDMGAQHDVATTGRFLMIKDPAREPATEMVVVRNWIEDLRERVPIP